MRRALVTNDAPHVGHVVTTSSKTLRLITPSLPELRRSESLATDALEGRIKMLRGWKTIIINAAVAAATAALAHFSPEVVSEMAGAWAPVALIGLSFINIGLRSVTATPVGKAS